MEKKDNVNNVNNTDLKLFEKGMKGLFVLIKTIIRCHNKQNFSISSKKNPILIHLEKYEQIYEKTEHAEHTQYFLDIYTSYRSRILRGQFRDDWLRDGKVIITYGSEAGCNSNSKILLSDVYNIACDIRKDIEDSLGDLPDVDESKELLYPTAFMLHLYRIFCSIAPKDDSSKLSNHLNEILSNLGIQTTPNTSSNNNSDSSAGDNNGLQPLFNMAKQMMGKVGINIPDGQMPKLDDLTGSIGQMLNQPETMNMFGDLFGDLKDSSNMGEAMNKIVGKLGNESLQKKIAETMGNPVIQDTFNSTVDSAISSSETEKSSQILDDDDNDEFDN
jgi:hypothetical protein